MYTYVHCTLCVQIPYLTTIQTNIYWLIARTHENRMCVNVWAQLKRIEIASQSVVGTYSKLMLPLHYFREVDIFLAPLLDLATTLQFYTIVRSSVPDNFKQFYDFVIYLCVQFLCGIWNFIWDEQMNTTQKKHQKNIQNELNTIFIS